MSTWLKDSNTHVNESSADIGGQSEFTKNAMNEINEKETEDNIAFTRWIDSDNFLTLSNTKKDDLILYVAGLNHIIAKLRSDQCRSKNEIVESCALIAENQERGTRYQWTAKSLFGNMTKEIANKIRTLKQDT